MSVPTHPSFPHAYDGKRENTISTFKRQLSATEMLKNAYIMGPPSFNSLMKEWGKGEVFVSSTLQDEIFFESFVGDVVQAKITPRKNCAVKLAVELLLRGDTYRVAKLFASHARLYRQSHDCTLAGQTVACYGEYEEALNPDYFDVEEEKVEGLEKAIKDGAPLGLAKARGKAHAQVVLVGAEYFSTPKKAKKTTESLVKNERASYTQATLF